VQRYEVNWRYVYKEKIAKERGNLQFYRPGRKKKKKFFSSSKRRESQ